LFHAELAELAEILTIPGTQITRITQIIKSLIEKNGVAMYGIMPLQGWRFRGLPL
jgi:hypothetical protein